jgi:chromosome segregation ATPase
MASKSENTFGSRIKNAQDIITIVETFTDFKPLKPEDDLSEVTNLIANVKASNQEEATYLQQYSVSTTTRINKVTNDADSLKKIISPIRAYLSVIYDKNDKQYTNINTLLTQITGKKIAKEKKETDEKSVSVSQQSYASLVQAFSDTIVTLSTLTPPYTPTNETITLKTLKNKHAEIEEINKTITTNFNALTTARQRRNSLYEDLKSRVQRIKKTVQSQYGNTSTEYERIKGIKI